MHSTNPHAHPTLRTTRLLAAQACALRDQIVRSEAAGAPAHVVEPLRAEREGLIDVLVDRAEGLAS